jgi:hypothetical protein
MSRKWTSTCVNGTTVSMREERLRKYAKICQDGPSGKAAQKAEKRCLRLPLERRRSLIAPSWQAAESPCFPMLTS